MFADILACFAVAIVVVTFCRALTPPACFRL
jgi:hypothetical protein